MADSLPAPRVLSRSFRIHVRGAVFASMTLAIGVAAVVRGNNLFFVIFSTLAGVLVASVLLTILGVRRLEFSRELPETAASNRPFDTRLRVRNRRRLIPVLALRIEDRLTHEGRVATLQPPPVLIPLCLPGRKVRATGAVTAYQRGWAKFGPITLVSEQPPGLCTYRVTLELPGQVLVFPRDAVLSRGSLEVLRTDAERRSDLPVSSVAGLDDFAGVREYREGDNPRWIHWKLSARVPGRTYLREFEASRTREALILLDTYVPNAGDLRRRSRLERAISFAQALAEALLERRQMVRVRAAMPEPAEVVLDPGTPSIAELRSAFALLRPSRTHRVSDLWREEELPPGAAVFVLSLDDDTEVPGDRAVRIPASEMRRHMFYVD